MTALDTLFHALGFAAPAFVVAALVALAGRGLTPRGAGWRASFALNCVAGLAVLAGGLWWFGTDGRMATYAALVAVVASCQWLIGRGWRG